MELNENLTKTIRTLKSRDYLPETSFSLGYKSVMDIPFLSVHIKSKEKETLTNAFRDYLTLMDNEIYNVAGSKLAENVLNERMKKRGKGSFIFGNQVIDDTKKINLLNELRQLS